ncbi:MAG: hypothetical protein K9M45_07420 [Kiritimatiellales bacterium]|nr:hypothetical protein [Kiritimatiellales bacterium]
MKNREKLEEQKGNTLISKNRKRAGVSLVETFMAVVIFSMFSTGVCQLVFYHRKMLDTARAHYTAVNIAKNRLERLRSVEFDQIPDFSELQIPVNASGRPETGTPYRRSTTVTTVSTNLYQLDVTVEIQDRETLAFGGSEEKLVSFFSHYLEPEE